MTRRVAIAAVVTTAAAVALLPASAQADRPVPTLLGRAVLPAEAVGEGSSPAPAPFPDQPVGGFSDLSKADGGSYWALADNGYGSKANSADFLLRIYRIALDPETAKGGSGDVQVLDFVQLADPHGLLGDTVQAGEVAGRPLTGADFDPESLVVTRDGFWIGDEFGPYLLHFGFDGALLEEPVPLPGVKSPDSNELADGESATLPRSGGFEGLAGSTNGRYLYPVLEKALLDDVDQTRRLIYEYDVAAGQYTDTRWAYRAEDADNVVGGVATLNDARLLVIERDFSEGAEAEFSRVYVVRLGETDSDGYLVKREVLDLLAIRDPSKISLPARPGDVGLGDPFAFPFITVEAVLPLNGRRLLLANDDNFGSTGRNPDLPDDNEFIVVDVPFLTGKGRR